MTKRVIPPTVAELRDHVRELCRAFGIQIVEEPAFRYEDGVSFHTTPHADARRLIIIRPVLDEVSYGIGMHELGHCRHPHGVAETEDLQLTTEQNAWEWAEYASLDWTPAMEHVKQICLKRYTEKDAERRLKRAKLLEQDKRRAEDVKNFLQRLNL